MAFTRYLLKFNSDFKKKSRVNFAASRLSTMWHCAVENLLQLSLKVLFGGLSPAWSNLGKEGQLCRHPKVTLIVVLSAATEKTAYVVRVKAV